MRGIISERTKIISSSATLKITAKAKAMRQEGIDVISLAAGEPDFDTPKYIKDEAKSALDCGFTKYTPASGIHELKEAICKKFKLENGLDYQPSEVIVSNGAKQSLYNAIQVLCDDKDEVILPVPYWVSYPEQVKLSGAKLKLVRTQEKEGFKLTPSALRKTINRRAKLLILNSPNNPTGSIYSKEELQWISNILVEAGIYCISDEIYERFIYDGCEHISIASLGPGIKRLTITINGLSKAFSMTGWRIGYAAARKEIIQAMSNLQSHTTSCPNSIAQKAALAALSGPKQSLKKMQDEFRKRRDCMVKGINRIRGLSCLRPAGAFYVFVNASGIMDKKFKGKKIKDSLSLSQVLLSEAHVATIPGSAFGSEGYLRLSYTLPIKDIQEGLKRIEGFASSLK